MPQKKDQFGRPLRPGGTFTPMSRPGGTRPFLSSNQYRPSSGKLAPFSGVRLVKPVRPGSRPTQPNRPRPRKVSPVFRSSQPVVKKRVAPSRVRQQPTRRTAPALPKRTLTKSNNQSRAKSWAKPRTKKRATRRKTRPSWSR